MRYQEFKSEINEVALGGKYWDTANNSHDSYIPKLIDKIESGGNIAILIKNELIPISFTDEQRKNALALLKKQVNSQSLYGQNIKDKITGTDEDGEIVEFSPLVIDKTSVKFTVNAGNVTEGVLGFALAARFARTSQPVTESEVMRVGRAFFNSDKSEINIKVADRTDDLLKLKVTLPKGDTRALRLLIEADGRGNAVAKELGLSAQAASKLDKLINQAVQYANTGLAPNGALDKIISYYNDNVKQVINVVSDGAEAENQNMTKVDLSLIVDPESGETETLSLLSLKAGAGPSQIGQASGKNYEKLALFWKQCFAYQLPNSFEAVFQKVIDDNTEDGKVIMDNQTAMDLVNGPILQSYEWAEEKIQGHLRGDTVAGEVEFLRHLQKGLLYHSGKDAKADDPTTKVKGNEDVIVTILNPDAKTDYIEINFNEQFYEIMKYFDLSTNGVTRQGGDTGIILRVDVTPSANISEAPEIVQQMAKQIGKGKVLCRYRTYVQGKSTVRNIVEIEKGGKILADISVRAKMQAPDDLKPTTPKQQVPTAASPQAPVDQTKQTNDPNATI